MTVNKERVELWAQALESGGYNKCAGNLGYVSPLGHIMHCAEGVAMEVAQAHGVKIHPQSWLGSAMPPQVRQWYGFSFTGGVIVKTDGQWYGFSFTGGVIVKTDEGAISVIAANDSLNMSFWDIAQSIRTTFLKDES